MIIYIKKDPVDHTNTNFLSLIHQKVIKSYMNVQLYQIFQSFNGTLTPYNFSPYNKTLLKPSIKQIKSVYQYISQAKRPLLLISNYSCLYAEHVHKLHQALTIISIPTYLSSMARGLYYKSHPFYMRQNRTKAIQQCDCLILCGIIMDFRLKYGQIIPKNIPIITIHSNKKLATLNSDLF